MAAYLTLFISALGAATLLPLQSEAVLLGLLLLGQQPALALLMVATLGNVLGALINWYLGRRLEHWENSHGLPRWFPVPEQRLEQARAHYQRWGHVSLLLSWLPIIGDPLTLVAGLMREPLWRFLLWVTLAKGGRYAVLIYLGQASLA